MLILGKWTEVGQFWAKLGHLRPELAESGPHVAQIGNSRASSPCPRIRSARKSHLAASYGHFISSFRPLSGLPDARSACVCSLIFAYCSETSYRLGFGRPVHSQQHRPDPPISGQSPIDVQQRAEALPQCRFSRGGFARLCDRLCHVCLAKPEMCEVGRGWITLYIDELL